MPSQNLSAKQEEILAFLKKEILSRGFPPTVREICDAVRLKSTSSVHAHLEKLEECLDELDISDRNLVIAYFDKSINFSKYAEERGEGRVNLIHRVERIVRELRKKMNL